MPTCAPWNKESFSRIFSALRDTCLEIEQDDIKKSKKKRTGKKIIFQHDSNRM